MIELPEDEILLQAESHTYLYRKKMYKSVTGYIQDAGLGPDFSMVPKHIMDRAKDRGTKVHQACHYINENDLDIRSVDPAIHGYVMAYKKFLSECRVKPIAIEKKMVEPRFADDVYGDPIGLAGTPDLICWLNGRRVVVDYKTCATLPKSVGMQLIGYKLLWERRFPNFRIYERYGLSLKPDGNYKLKKYESLDDHMAFYDAVHFVAAKERRDHWIKKYKFKGDSK